MYNKNTNVLSAIIQSPISPRSTNVLWDDMVSNTLKVYRKGRWTVIGGAGGGGGGEGSPLYWGYDAVTDALFPLEGKKVQINNTLTVNGDIRARKLNVEELTIDGENFNQYWELDPSTNTLYTNYQVKIGNNLIVEGDTSSGGNGQDTPAADGSLSNLSDVSLGSLSEGDVLVYDKDNGVWYNVSQSKIVPNLEGYAKQTWVTENFLKSDTLDAYKEELGKEVKGIADLLNSMWRIEGDNLVTDKQVLIKNNLIVEQDTSSGGEGQDTPAEGTVTGIEVNGTPYEPNTQGVIDLSDAFKAIDVSDQLKDYYTQTQTDSAISTAIANLINGAPTTLDTLKEIADALAENEDVVDALEEAIGKKADNTTVTALAERVSANEGAIDDNAGNIKKNFDAIDALDKRVTAEEAVTTTYKTWWADLKKYIKVEGGNVKIDTNLIVEGDTSSGGSGQDTPASGTVTGIKVSSTQTLTPNNAGIIDMVSVLSSIDVSDQLKDYAKLTDITKSRIDSVLGSTTAGNANRFLMSTGSTSVWASISDYALPLSGGKMTGTITVGDYTAFGQTGGNFYLGTPAYPLLLRSNGTTTINGNTLIHSGNIGSQSVAEAKRLLSPYSYPSNVITNTTTADSLFSESYSFSAMQEDHPLFGYATIWNFSAYLKFGATQLAAHYNALTPRLALRNYNQNRANWSEWREFAFLDDNVASATKLQTARTIWGQSFNGTGNVSGHLSLGTYAIKGQQGSAFEAPSYVAIGYATSAAGYATYIDGYNIYLRSNTTHNEGLILNSSGNVTIGGSDLAGTSAKLYVDNGMVTIVRANSATQYYGDNATFKICTANPSGASVVLGLSAHTSEYCTIQSTKIGTGAMPLSINPSGGNVLIGTTDDDGAKLQVAGQVSLTSSIYWGDASWYTIGAYTETSGVPPFGRYIFYSGHIFKTASGEALRINSYGNVVFAHDIILNHIVIDGSNDIYSDNGLYIQPAGGGDVNINYLGTNTIINQVSGNVGIGTASPAFKLDVSGAINTNNHVFSKYGYRLTGGTSGLCGLFAEEFIGGNINPDLWLYTTTKANIYAPSGVNITGAVTMSNTLSVSGNVGIGTASPSAKLHVSYNSGTAGIEISRTSNGDEASIAFNSDEYPMRSVIGGWSRNLNFYHNGATRMTISDTGAVTMSSTLSVGGNTTINGNLVVSGDTSSGSDIRFKDIIKNKTIKIEHIAKAPLFTFKWNDRDDDSIHLGSSAQYWEKVTPWLVKGEDFKTLDYSTLGVAMGISLAKKAVNHEERIKALERKVKSLEEENRRLRYGN